MREPSHISCATIMGSVRRAIVIVCLISGGLLVDQLSAAEPYEAFLEALRRERYHDLALVYLDQLEKRTDVPAEFRASIPYQRALLAFAAIDEDSDLARRMQRLDVARKLVEQARESTIDPDQQVKLGQLALDTLAAKARLLVIQANHARPENTQQLRADADSAFTQAIAAAETFTADLKSKLEALAKEAPERQDPTQRENWRTAYLAAQIAVPTLRLESAELIQENGPAYRDRIRSAADECQQLLEKYSVQRPDAYLPLTLLSARCYQALEDYDKALVLYSEILDNDLLPDQVTSMATQLSMECWSSAREAKLDKAIATGESWLSEHARAKPTDAAPVRVALARCLLKSAAAAPENARAKTYARARMLLVDAVRTPGPWCGDAQQLLGTIPFTADHVETADNHATFAEAKLAGDTALGSLQAAEQAMSLASMRANPDSTEDQPPEFEAEVEKSEEDIPRLRDTAIAAYRRALDLVKFDTPVEEVTQVQYLLAYLLYQKEEYYDAAVLAEYVARERSDSVQARSSIRTAMAAFSQLLEQGSSSSAFAENYLKKLAEYAAQRWPNDEEGQAAVVTIVRLLVNRGRVTDAQEYLNRIPDSSPWRAEAEISTGIALFREYQKAVRANGDDSAARQIDPAQMRQVAQELLEAGLKRIVATDATSLPVLAHLILAQIHLDGGSTKTALELLHDPRRGPFTLVQQDAGVTRESGFAESILQTELRARILALAEPNVNDADRELSPVVDSLAKTMGDSPAGKQRLVSVLIRLANELNDRIGKLPAGQRTAHVAGFDAILSPVVNSSQDAEVLNWVAHTLATVVDSLEGSDATTADRRKQTLALAASALQNALQLQEKSTDPQARLQTLLRLASVKRRQHDFRGAIPLFAEVLESNPNLLNVQIEAAHTYREGGAFQYAVKGGRPSPKSKENVIWGWEKISAMLARQMKRGESERAKYESLFHEARYQIARCRYEQALESTGEKRKDYLEAAKRAIETTAALYPELGGPDRKSQYDSLRHDIEQALTST